MREKRLFPWQLAMHHKDVQRVAIAVAVTVAVAVAVALVVVVVVEDQLSLDIKSKHKLLRSKFTTAKHTSRQTCAAK